MRIGPSARKHGVADADMLHAARHAARELPPVEGVTMLLGPDRAARFIEVGVLGLDTADPVIIHAMPIRPKFQQLL